MRLALPYVIVCSIVLLLHRRQLDLLRVGDDEASSLGSPVARVRLVVVLAATFGTAAVVAVSGLIGFVGIVVPHFVRLVAGSGYRRVLPLSLLLGAAFLILADIPSRVLTDPAEMPIGVVTAFIGAPFFLVVLRARHHDELARAARRLGDLRAVGRPGAVQRHDQVGRVARPDRARTGPASRRCCGPSSVSSRAPATILVDGAPLALRSSRRRAELVAYVPQEPLMPDDMTAAEYVLLGRSPYISYFSSPDPPRPGDGRRRARPPRHGELRRPRARARSAAASGSDW